ncbi:carboxymuconolactone decarboxylase family protein [Hydrogenophaga sp. T2]|uniref:carboxymuconolactone decarboxylase family protein n=1 Tax=Hydrogenophaga sp. T2 TaxID=3132823 RepID=UPI003CED81E1
MTRLTLHTAESAPPASQPWIEQSVRHNGYLPNLIGVLANAPLALEAYFTLGAINARASLTLAEREVVQITAAQLHGCDFCVAGHSAVALRKAGLDAASVVALQRVAATGNARLDAVQAFTQAVIEHRGAVPDGALQAFLSVGFDQEQALEVVLGVSLASLCNFANSLAQSPVNPQLQAYRAGVLRAEHSDEPHAA